MFSSIYTGALDGGAVFDRLPAEAQEATRESVGAAGVVADQLGPHATAYLGEVNDAFLSGLSAGSLVAAAVALAGAVFAHRFLPARA